MGMFKRFKRKFRNSVKTVKRVNKRVGKKTRKVRGFAKGILKQVPVVGTVVTTADTVNKQGGKLLRKSKSFGSDFKKVTSKVDVKKGFQGRTATPPFKPLKSRKPKKELNPFFAFFARLFGLDN